MSIEITVEQEQIDAYEETAREFLRGVFDLDYGKVMLTDGSSLSDFFPSGLSLTNEEIQNTAYSELVARWDRWVVERVRQRYGLEGVYVTMPLIALFEAIQQPKDSEVLH